MRIERIRLRGVASFRGEVVLDLTQEPFASSGIFVISGPTGAGKSTILDAITLALYHKTPRLHGKGHRNPQNVINLHTDEGFVEVTFSVRGERYLAKYVMRRGKTPRASLVKLPGEVVLADRAGEVEREVERLVGMDFEAFRRAVILPQGEFTAFLKADTDRKREILEAVTGIDVYERLKDLYNERWGSLVKEVEVLERVLEERRAALVGVREEEIVRRLKGVKGKRGLEEKKLKDIKERLRDAERRLELQRELEELKRREKELVEEEEKIKEQERRIELLERSVGELKGEYDYLRKLMGVVEERRREVDELRERVESGERMLRKIRAEGEIRMKDLERERAEVKALLDHGKGLRRLYPLLERYRIKRSALEEVKEKERAVHEALKGDRDEMARVLKMLKDGYTSHMKHLKLLERRVEGLKEEMRMLEERREEARRRSMALEIRKGLKEGDQCPVCGGVYRPESSPELTPDESLKDVERALEKGEKDLKEAEMALQRGLAVAEIFPEEVRAGDSEREEVGELSAEWVRRSVKRWLSLRTSVNSRREELERLEGERENLERDIVETERALKKAGIEDVEGALKESDRILPDMEKLEQKYEALREEVEGIKERLREEEESLERERERWKAKEENLSDLLKELKILSGRFLERISGFGFSGMEEFEKALEEYREIQKMRDAVEGYRREMEHLKKRLEEVRSALGERGASISEVKELREKEAEAERRIGDLRKEEGELEQRLRDLKEKKRLLEEVEEKYREIVRRREVWEALGTLMRNNRLRDYALEMVLEYLLELANEHLSILSEGRYLFSADEGRILSSLKVMDMWSGGERRPVETLSGGEQFLASLSLALALSEMSARSGEVGSFFLDEGFGTLDSRSLEMVLDALERLRGEGRVIGVISHIEEVKRRIPVKVLVKKSPEGARIQIHPPPPPSISPPPTER